MHVLAAGWFCKPAPTAQHTGPRAPLLQASDVATVRRPTHIPNGPGMDEGERESFMLSHTESGAAVAEGRLGVDLVGRKWPDTGSGGTAPPGDGQV